MPLDGSIVIDITIGGKAQWLSSPRLNKLREGRVDLVQPSGARQAQQVRIGPETSVLNETSWEVSLGADVINGTYFWLQEALLPPALG